MERNPETYLLISEITSGGGFAKYWNRVETSMKARGLTQRDANRCWYSLRPAYFQELLLQSNLATW